MPSSDVRESYEAAVTALAEAAARRLASGECEEQVARWAVAQRTALKRHYRALTPPDVLAAIEARSLLQYGEPMGPSIEALRARGKSWRAIIDSASRPGGGPGHW
jgi:hypothetical protein